jgi:hypothetical protein
VVVDFGEERTRYRLLGNGTIFLTPAARLS